MSPSDLINNIGRPFDNTSAFVLDPNSNTILPRGAVGELCFGGYQVFQGYLNRPDLTAAKIISHPTYGRIYRSGDLGMLLSDDSILFSGRLDDQVKIRGQRVELGEISSTILDQQCVRDCSTLLLQLSQDLETLVTFWVPTGSTVSSFTVLESNDFRTDVLAMFAALSHRLPTYMVPSYLIAISRLPITTQGKIDKRLLQRCFVHLSDEAMELATQSYDALGGPTITTTWEIQVAQILAETLRISSDNIKRGSSFFNLGLDSVSAISFGNQLRKANLGHFTISEILKNATIAHLAALKDTQLEYRSNLQGPVINAEQLIAPDEISRIQNFYISKDMPISKIRPCTPLQEAMLSSGQSTSGTSYSNMMVFSVDGSLSQLQESWAHMVGRHEILRTSFFETDNPSFAFAQVVLEDANLQWGYMDWSSGTHQHANKMVAGLLRENKPPVWLAISESDHSTRLFFCCHHAIYDGLAIRILLREVQEVYHHQMLPPPVSYDPYLQDMLSQNFAEADSFWTASFRDFEPTAFPDLTGKANKEPQLCASWQQRLRLPLGEVREACQNQSVTLLAVIHATWAKLLCFYTGVSDVCFGNVVSGRALPGHDLERLVAPCFNTLPVRINFDLRKKNVALAKQAHAFNIGSSAFQLTPLRRIQNIALKDSGRLFDTLVILQQPSEPLDSTIWTLEEDRGDMDMPLVCEIAQNEAEDRLDLTLHYHSTILSEKEAIVLAETFDATLGTIINQPDASASDTTGLPQSYQSEISSSIKDLESRKQYLHSGFEEHAQNHPDRTALKFLHADGARTIWTYRTLNEKANDIAYTLIENGVKPEQIVPIHISKSPTFYASILGVLKAGAAFAPVHPGLPDERRRLMLEDLNADLVLCTNDSILPSDGDGVKIIDAGAVKTSAGSDPVVNSLTNSNLAYCIFTSGSTGVPKAVSMEHCAPMQTIECSRSLVPWCDSSRLLQYAATTFDMCYYDCFLTWTLGFALCAAEQDMMLNELPKIINDLNVDLLDLTPSVAASLVRSDVPCVKWLYCIGEAMTRDIVEKWEGVCVNSYGPSETAFCTTIYPVSKDVQPSVIGAPFSSTSFAVFPESGDRPLPLLSIGELYIGGAQLARGYYNRAELTAERFVTKCGQRFYRSGDIVRMLSDRNFEFIGRADDQVKIRGLRVELGEINNTLRNSHPDVVAVATQILRKDATAKEQLVAFLVTRQPIGNDKRDEIRHVLRQAAKLRLPPYMVPQFFTFIDEIPRSLAGKVDKRALTKIFQLTADVGTLPNGTAKHSWTTLESQIRHVFVRLSSSRLEEVSSTTTIYQLGLDSISAVQVASALRKEGHRVNAADVMKYLTCLDLAAYLEQNDVSEQPATERFDFVAFDRTYRPQVIASCNVLNEHIAAVRPCTPLQRGMVSQMLAREGAIYVNYLRLELDPSLDLDVLKQAWEKVVAKHQILRTGFVHLNDKGHPFGMIEYIPEVSILPWNVVSESDPFETPEVWLERLQRLATSELYKPLWDIRIVRRNDTKYLDLGIFHALFDAQSLQSILRDVVAAYSGVDLQSPVELDPVIDGILRRSTSYSVQAKEFWARMGKQAIPYRFPNLAPLRYNPQSPKICAHQSKRSLSEIEEACRRSNTSLQAVGLASWLSLISAYTGEPTVTCGVVLSGRSFEDAEDAVFPCINTVPFAHAVIVGSRDMLNAVTSLITEVQQHQHVPLNDIQRLMGFQNEALFDTIFAYQKLPDHKDKDVLWRTTDERATIEYPVSIELEPNGDHLDYRLTVTPHSIPQEQAALILEQLDDLVQCFLFESERTEVFNPSLYSVTPAKEPTLPSEARLLHDFVELTAKNYPERIALEFAESIHKGDYSAQSWTYSDLDAEGNRVANLLTSNGVQPGDLVCVCFDKCPEASFAMLGVLKAGGAFVAIDPGAPSARQSFIVRDSGATAVLSMSAQSAGFAEDVNVPVLNLDNSRTSSLPDTKPILGREINSQDRSYCLYTSGTTGTPKGCELSHENAVQALLAFQRLFAGHWDTRSRWLQFASFHFDVSVLEQYWSWSVGICVVSAPRDVIFEDLANSINTLCITHIDLTPSLAQILHPDDVPSLCKGVFITGGESLKQEILDVWGPKGVIYNGYGPTEATIGCTMYPRVPANGKPSNIGPQFDNVGSFVLLPNSDIPVLRGGIGELCVSGKLVGKGYLNRDELTEKSFPYLDRFEERVYRTGDLVRILHDGTFEFLGRADDQVKLRGQRLEIGEINSVIRQSNKNITDVATLVLKHLRQQKEQLVAFIVQGRTKKLPEVLLHSTSEMIGARDACHESLPPYMVPTHFIPLTSLPLNINNKADVKKLKGLYETLSATDLQKLSITSDGRRESWSSFETKLRTVLMAELGVGEDAIGKETSFFELGMDSISVIGVVRAFKQASISGANASMIMKHSTVRRLAKVISTEGASASDRASLIEAQQAIHAMQHRHRHAVAQILSVNTSDIEALSPCTPLQHGMIAKSLESENRVYFNTFKFELSDKIDVDRLRAAWQVVHASIQILRTAFVNTEEGYVQAVLRHLTLPWKMETASKDDSLDKDLTCLRKTWLQSNQNDFAQPLELICITLPGKRLLLVNIFHGLYDGISVELVFKAVWDAYNGHETDTDAPSFQSVLAYGPLRTVDGARTFWQNHLSNDNARSRISVPSHSTSEVIKLARELRNLDKLESTRRKLNVTAQAVAQACWLSVLQELKKGTVATGVVVSGRSIDLEGADRIIGPMFNTIPYQHRRHKSESWGSIIKRVHDFNVAAHPYQHTPLRDIIKWCKTDRNQPLFDNLFVYQVAQTDDDWARNEAWQLLDGDTVADYPLAFEVEQGAHGMWKLTLVAQNHVFDERTSLELLDNFENALYHALENPETMFKTSMELNDVVETKLVEDEDATSPTGNKTDFEWTEEANKIRKLLAELTNTGLEDIHEDTSILELGLDSIDAIKLSSKLKKCGVNLPVSGIMRGLTVPKMLPYISKPKGAAVEQSTFDAEFEKRKDELRGYIERQDMNTSQIEHVLPLTPLQEAMVAEMVSSEFTRYYNFDVLELEHETNVDRLRNAWIQVVEVSPILRTSFVEIDDPAIAGSFAQVVQAQSHNFWSTTTLDDEPDFSALFEKTRRDARQSFSAEPPFQVQIFKSPNQTYLILSIAHALYDGWALSLLHADVKRAYEDNLILRPDYQPTLSEIITTSGAGAPTFWSDYLSEAKPSIFDKRNISARTPVIVHRLEQNSKLEIAAIMKFAKKSNISLQTLGQSVFAIVLASYFRSLDVTFGSVLSGRNDETTSQLLFPTMNTVAIRTILHGSRLELLRHVQDSFTNVKQWQHFPLRKALALAGTHTRLFESLFIYQKSVEGSGEDGRQLYTSVEGHSDVEYPVCVEMEVVHEQLVWRSAIKNMVFDEADSKAFLNKLDEVLRAIVESPERPVIEFASQGISLCGLSAFEEQQPVSNKARNDKVQPQVDQPQAETVHAIRQVLAIASDTPEYEITDNMTIFHIGLDSISAIKVSSLLRRRGVVLSVGEMLRAGSVDNMARIVDARSNQHAEDDQDHAFVIKEALHDLNLDGVLHNANSEGCGIKDLSEVHMLPATAGQLYMLSMWLNTRGSNFYPEFTYKITGEMTFEKLQNAWKNLVDTNSILRTYLVTTQDPRIPYVQLVRKKGEAVVSIVDITYHSQNRATQGVDLSDMKQPWTHLRIAQTQDGWVLKLKIHHALYDGVSLPIMIQQLQDICNGSTVPSPHGTIENFTAKSITPQALETRKSFWTQYLADISQHPLQQPISSVSTKTEIFKPGLLLTKPLEETARQNGLSTQALFLASYAKLYAILTHTQRHHDVVLGIYLANRSLPITGIENAPIPTVNLLPLRVHTPLEQGTIEVAQQIQQDLQKIGEHANAAVSLYEIKEWTRVTVDTFVNFLTLPNTVEEESQEENTQENVRIVPVSEWNEERSRVVEHTAVAGIDERVLETLTDKEVNEVYLVSHHTLHFGVGLSLTFFFSMPSMWKSQYAMARWMWVSSRRWRCWIWWEETD
jgi:amino acid adenylation domain-containing protein